MVCVSVTPRDSQGLRPPAEGGHTRARRREGRNPRPNSRCPPAAGGGAGPRPYPASLAGERRLGRKTAAGSGGAPGRAHHRASGRRRPARREARPGAESAAASGRALRRPLPGPPGRRHPFPHRGTCTARLRKVPASAASFLTLKSMMFILGCRRAELPADLAGRRGRRGRAGAPGDSGGGRRGRWREAAPAPPPQLSFP